MMSAAVFTSSNAADPLEAASTPAATPRLVGLQQLRFLAALLVLVHHALEECSIDPNLPVAKWLILLGASGVDIFFVISGFVIWRTTRGLGASTPASVFMKKRLLRVLPLYWLFLSFVVVVWGSSLALRSTNVTPLTLLESFMLLPVTGGHGLIMGVAWTLIYEIYFYTLCAIALCCPHEKSRPLLLIVMLVAIPLLLVAVGAVQIGGYYGNPIVTEFVFGCVIAKYSATISRSKFTGLVAVGGIAGLVAAAWLLDSVGTVGLSAHVRWWGWGIPAAMLVVACVGDLRVPDRAGGRVLAVLGDASYALYLTHGFVMIGLARWLKANGAQGLAMTLLLGSVAILMAIAVSYIVHIRVERPLMRWLGARSAAFHI